MNYLDTLNAVYKKVVLKKNRTYVIMAGAVSWETSAIT